MTACDWPSGFSSLMQKSFHICLSAHSDKCSPSIISGVHDGTKRGVITGRTSLSPCKASISASVSRTPSAEVST